MGDASANPVNNDDDDYEAIADFLCSSLVVKADGSERLAWLKRLGLAKYVELADLDAGDTGEQFVYKLLPVLFEDNNDLPKLLFSALSRHEQHPDGGSIPERFRKLINRRFGRPPDEYLRALVSHALGMKVELHLQIDDLCRSKAEYLQDLDGRAIASIHHSWNYQPDTHGRINVAGAPVTIVRGPPGIGKSVCRFLQQRSLRDLRPSVLVVEPQPSDLLADASARNVDLRQHLTRHLLVRILETLNKSLHIDSPRRERFAKQSKEHLIRYAALCTAFKVGHERIFMSDEGDDAKIRDGITAYLEDLTEGQRRLAHWLSECYTIVSQAGFESIYLLVDRLSDEAALGQRSLDQVITDLAPILKSADVLVPDPHMSRVYWKLFLRDDLADRIEPSLLNAKISYTTYRLNPWKRPDLLQMVEQALSHHVRILAPDTSVSLPALCTPEAAQRLNDLIDRADGFPARCWDLIEKLFTRGYQTFTIPLTLEIIDDVIRLLP